MSQNSAPRIVREPTLHSCPIELATDPPRGTIIECGECKAWWEFRHASYWKMDPFEKFFAQIGVFLVNLTKVRMK